MQPPKINPKKPYAKKNPEFKQSVKDVANDRYMRMARGRAFEISATGMTHNRHVTDLVRQSNTIAARLERLEKLSSTPASVFQINRSKQIALGNRIQLLEATTTNYARHGVYTKPPVAPNWMMYG